VDPGEKVTLSKWRAEWSTEFEVVARKLKGALGSVALRIDHIGSTSVPGLSAKDVIDVQVIVRALDRESIVRAMATVGFEPRDNEWNLRDHLPAGWTDDPDRWSKLVFASPPDVRTCNVHVRVAGSPNERYALLFRDFLRADAPARIAWGRFKSELAAQTNTLAGYGAVKDPATDVLLAHADVWAARVGWAVPEH
jgi:GrpB-like predicted nucleotidyltransferase (UPF0157 family)